MDAHEINNLLVYVILGLELIEREAGAGCDREKIRALVKDALDGAEKIRAQLKQEPSVRSLPKSSGRARLLLVEDDPRMAVALAAGLGESAEIVAAHTGADALAKLASGQFDLILCDLSLPDISGIDVYERAPAALREKFVFMSGGAKDERARAFLAAHPRLDKPFRLDQLEALLTSPAGRAAPRAGSS